MNNLKVNACECGATLENKQLRLQWFVNRITGEKEYEIVCSDCGTVAAGFCNKAEAVKFWNEIFSKKRGN